jgi:hypothetical protein
MIGIYGSPVVVGSGNRFAGYFAGNVTVTGTLSKAADPFRIDHPLDPENKTLSYDLSPLAYGFGEECSVEWARNPEVMAEEKRLSGLEKELK